ncbi:hypothetical protein DTL42_19430 [Bremerella cremea]|uniref:Uncharacterized protein n=1 Tax=Bremerella cremea TaxID=1031537 RepID=A0A368KMB4_9BACT|nr:hypothetical protein [Bremerella cremea]RCS42312.1 hypothetical protein DTL42_19430 [Bremerella cremea]
MHASKVDITMARVCRALRSTLDAPFPMIAAWTGINQKTVEYQVRYRQNVPVDNAETSRALLLWWFSQRLPAATEPPPQAHTQLIRDFDRLLQKAKELHNDS